jgi:hypothetical protein
MDTQKQDLVDTLAKASDAWNEAMDEIEQDSEQYWNSLSKEDQLKVFCAVCRRIYQGDIVDKGTYRYVLYQVFGFGPEAYAPAQLAGYLAIHNSIFDNEHDFKLLAAFASFLGQTTDEVAKNVDRFLHKQYL